MNFNFKEFASKDFNFNSKDFNSILGTTFSDEEIEKLNKEQLLGAINLIEKLLENNLFNSEHKIILMGINLKLILKLQTLKKPEEHDDISFYSDKQRNEELNRLYCVLYLCYSLFEDDEIFKSKIRTLTKKLKHILISITTTNSISFPTVDIEAIRYLSDNNDIKTDLKFFISISEA